MRQQSFYSIDNHSLPAYENTSFNVESFFVPANFMVYDNFKKKKQPISDYILESPSPAPVKMEKQPNKFLEISPERKEVKNLDSKKTSNE